MFLLFTPYFSQEEKQDKQKDSSMIVVTGTRRKKLLKDSVVKTEVLTREDIESMGARTIADTLGNVPGIEVRPAEAGQRGEIVRLQGLSAQNVLILVDGQRVIGRFNGAIDLTRFKVEDIERIEVVKGASSALYGSDAIAGVINIILREPTHDYQADFRSLYGNGREKFFGSSGEFRNTGSIGIKEKSYHTQFTAGWHRGDGYDLTLDASPGPKNHKFQSQKEGYNPYPPTLTLRNFLLARRLGIEPSPKLENTTANKFQDLNVTNKTTYYLTEDTQIIFNGVYHYLSQEGVDSAQPRRVFDKRNNTHDFMGAVGLESNITNHTHLSLNLNYSRFEDNFTYDQRYSDELDKKEALRNDLYEFRSRVDLSQLENHVFSLGLETLGDKARSNRIQVDCAKNFPNICLNDFLGLPPASDSGTAKRQRNAIYIQDEWKVLGKKDFSIIPGLRYEDDSQFGNQTMPKLSFRYDLSSEFLIRGSSGLGYRAPNFVELYYEFQNPGAGYRVKGNENLRPEISRSYNLGGEWEPTRKFWFSGNFFFNQIDNLIGFKLSPIRDTNGLQVFQTSNFEKVQTFGFESSINYKLNTRWNFILGYTYTNSKDLLTKLPIESVGFHRGNVSLRYYNEVVRFGFSIFGIFFGKQPFYCELEGLGCAPEAGSIAAQLYSLIKREDELQVFKSQIPLSIQKYCSEKNLPLCGEKPALGYRMVNSFNNINLRFFKKIEQNLEIFFGIDNLLEEYNITYNPQRPRFFYFGLSGNFKSDKITND